MPAVLHAGAHATDGMPDFPDGTRKLAVCSAERGRAAATASSQRAWAAAAASCGDWERAASSGERAASHMCLLLVFACIFEHVICKPAHMLVTESLSRARVQRERDLQIQKNTLRTIHPNNFTYYIMSTTLLITQLR